MAKEKTVTEIKDIFTSEGEHSWEINWSLNKERLREIISNEEVVNEIVENFEKMEDGTRFSAQMVHVTGENPLGDTFEYYMISLGHSIYSHHYRYHPKNNYWNKTIINQEFFEDIVQPFQKDKGWKAGDGLTRTNK